MCEERFLSLKPDNISLNEAASIPLAGLTAYQALKNYRGSLEGKTVFVPAGCKFSTSFDFNLTRLLAPECGCLTFFNEASI